MSNMINQPPEPTAADRRPGPAATQPRARRVGQWIPIVAVASIVLGFALGSSASRNPAQHQDCLQALDAADDMRDVAAEAMGLASEAMGAVAAGSSARLGLAADGMEDLTGEAAPVVAAYERSGDACRAG